MMGEGQGTVGYNRNVEFFGATYQLLKRHWNWKKQGRQVNMRRKRITRKWIIESRVKPEHTVHLGKSYCPNEGPLNLSMSQSELSRTDYELVVYVLYLRLPVRLASFASFTSVFHLQDSGSIVCMFFFFLGLTFRKRQKDFIF